MVISHFASSLSSLSILDYYTLEKVLSRNVNTLYESKTDHHRTQEEITKTSYTYALCLLRRRELSPTSARINLHLNNYLLIL